MAAVESKHVSFTYAGTEAQTDALHDVTLTVEAGECVLLCGKSGCGKTTFTHLLNGLSPAFFKGTLTGTCISAGLTAGEHPTEAYVPLCGSVFQNPKTQYFNVNTTAELAFPCENSGMPPEEIRRRVAECAKSFHLESLLDRSIFMLSGGEKQQIACGAACVLGPQLLVLDEPSGNLDAEAMERLHGMLLRMKELHMTIVIAEHRLAWLADVADRVFFFEEGALRRTFTRAEFAALPAETFHMLGLRGPDAGKSRAETEAKKRIPAPDRAPMLAVRALTVGYDKKHPVRTVEQFSVCRGEIVGLMGRNGSGKSTFARTLCGLLRPLSGEILLDGRPAAPKALMHESFLVMQDVTYQLFCDSVREEVLLGCKDPAPCDAVLEALGLTAFADRHPMSLSGGQKQRTAIASAMLSGKDFIILDEPTSGLDYYHMEQVGILLSQLKEQKKAVLVITHDEELAAGWCSRIVYFQKEELK